MKAERKIGSEYVLGGPPCPGATDGRSSKRQVKQICKYLDDQADYFARRSLYNDAAGYCQARAFVSAVLDGTPNAFEQTYEAVWRRPYQQHLQTIRQREQSLQRDGNNPDPQTFVIDGRNREEWALSVLDYLSWRGGRSWRPSRRRDPEQEFYDLAWRLVNCAMRGVIETRRQQIAGVAQLDRAPEKTARLGRSTPEVGGSSPPIRSNPLPKKKPVQSVQMAKRRRATA